VVLAGLLTNIGVSHFLVVGRAAKVRSIVEV
jgi:hypothetical protein